MTKVIGRYSRENGQGVAIYVKAVVREGTRLSEFPLRGRDRGKPVIWAVLFSTLVASMKPPLMCDRAKKQENFEFLQPNAIRPIANSIRRLGRRLE